MLDPFAGVREPLRHREEVPAHSTLEVSRWRRSHGVLWRVVLEDAVLLPRDRGGEPFALTSGRRLWEALAEERTFDELAEILGATAMEQDLTQLLDSLADTGAIERIPS